MERNFLQTITIFSGKSKWANQKPFTSIITAILCFGIVEFGYADSMEVERHMARGTAAMEVAKSHVDYLDAVEEFGKTVELAPDWADAWFNLGTAQEAAKQYQLAIKSFQAYLEKSPNASDRDAVETRLFKLEYKMEKMEREKAHEIQKREFEAEKFVLNLSGKWLVGTLKQLKQWGTESIYDLTVTSKNSFRMIHSYTKERISTDIINPSEKSEFDFSISEKNTIRGTYRHWQDLRSMNCRIEERSFPVTGKISDDGSTIAVSSRDVYLPNFSPCGWKKVEEFKRVFTRFD